MTLTALWISELVFKDAQFKGRAHHLYCVTVLHVFRAAIGHWAIILWYPAASWIVTVGCSHWDVLTGNWSGSLGCVVKAVWQKPQWSYRIFPVQIHLFLVWLSFLWLGIILELCMAVCKQLLFFSRLPPFNSSSNRFNDVKPIMAVCINCLMLLQVPLCFYLIRMCWLFT